MRKLFSTALFLFSFFVFYAPPGSAQNGTAAVSPTEISAELGTCSALINVTGADSKPLYNAKVTARIRYGFMGAKKLDLETFTSAERTSQNRKAAGSSEETGLYLHQQRRQAGDS